MSGQLSPAVRERWRKCAREVWADLREVDQRTLPLVSLVFDLRQLFWQEWSAGPGAALHRAAELVGVAVPAVEGDPVKTRAEIRARREVIAAARLELSRLDREHKKAEESADFQIKQRDTREARAAEVAQLAAVACQATWRNARPGGPWIVHGIERGALQVGNVHGGEVRAYGMRDGRAATGRWGWDDRLYPEVLDTVATLTAWRQFCADRRTP